MLKATMKKQSKIFAKVCVLVERNMKRCSYLDCALTRRLAGAAADDDEAESCDEEKADGAFVLAQCIV